MRFFHRAVTTVVVLALLLFPSGCRVVGLRMKIAGYGIDASIGIDSAETEQEPKKLNDNGLSISILEPQEKKTNGIAANELYEIRRGVGRLAVTDGTGE